MSDTARDYQTINAISTEGMADFFDVEVEASSSGDYLVSPTGGVPVDQAAKVLGLSVKTVKDRLRKGTLPGYKVKDKFGEKWLVVLGSGSQVLAGPTVEQLESTPSQVVPTIELVESTPSQVVPTVDLKPFLELLHKKDKELESAVFRNGYLERQIVEYSAQLKLLPDLENRAQEAIDYKAQVEAKELELIQVRAQLQSLQQNWWAKFSTWFFKGK